MEAGVDDGYGADEEACGEEFRDRESFRIRKECWEEFEEHKCGDEEDSFWDHVFGFAQTYATDDSADERVQGFGAVTANGAAAGGYAVGGGL